MNEPVVGAGVPRYGSQLSRKCWAPNGTSVTAASELVEVAGLAGGSKATSDRSGVPFRAGANATLSEDFPALVADSAAASVPLFPRKNEDAAAAAALLRAPTADEKAELTERGFVSTMRIPIVREGQAVGEFRLAHTTPRRPNLEVQAAAELLAQFFAMTVEIDRLKNP